MDAKTYFGVDYFHVAMEINARSKRGTGKSATVAKLLLVLSWGFTTDEVDQVNKIFWEKNKDRSLESFNISINRLISYLKTHEESKKKLLTDLIVVAGLDDDINIEERSLIFSIAEEFDLRKSEVIEIAERAENIGYTLNWFVKNYGID